MGRKVDGPLGRPKRTTPPRADALYGLIVKPAPEGAPPASMSMDDALAIAVRQAEARNPIDYAYIHALRAAAVRLDHVRTDDLATTLQTVRDLARAWLASYSGQEAGEVLQAIAARADESLNNHRGIPR